MRCEVCGFGYVPEDPRDATIHRREHREFLRGVAAKPLKSDCVVSHEDALRITLVKPDGPLIQRERIEKVARRANLEMEYSFGIYGANEKCNTELEIHALIGYRKDRAVTLLIFERRAHVWVASWGEDGEPCHATKIENAKLKWTIGFIWVLPKHRRQGIALKLLEQASRYTQIPLSELGWYTPLSAAGGALARHCCPDQILIVK